MFKALLRIKLASLPSMLTGGAKRGKKRGKGMAVLYALLMVYVIGVFCWMFAGMFSMLAEPLHDAGLSWLYFLMTLILAFTLMVIFSVFTAKSQLYEAKDNDLLLSMPIPPSAILASRMMLLLGLNLVFGLIIVVPSLIEWYAVVPFSLSGLASFLLTFIALVFFAMSISALFGWLISLLTSKMRNKTLFETVLSLAFLGGYFYLCGKMGDVIENVLMSSMGLADTLGNIAILKCIGLAAAGESLTKLLLTLVVLIIPFIIVYAVLARTFIKTATAKRGAAKIKYVDRGQKVSSMHSALFKREAARFFSSSTCIINNGLGAVFMIVAAVALVIYKNEVSGFIAMFGDAGDIVMCIVAVFGAMMAGLVLPTSSSVSLEGRSLWLVRSMPVSTREVLDTKLKFSLTIYVPPVILLMAAAGYVLRPGALMLLASTVFSLLLLFVMAQIGLIENIRHPNLNWTTETQAVKSGASVMISMLLDYGLIAALAFGGYELLKNGLAPALVMAIAAALMLILCLVLRSLLHGRVAARFENL